MCDTGLVQRLLLLLNVFGLVTSQKQLMWRCSSGVQTVVLVTLTFTKILLPHPYFCSFTQKLVNVMRVKLIRDRVAPQ